MPSTRSCRSLGQVLVAGRRPRTTVGVVAGAVLVALAVAALAVVAARSTVVRGFELALLATAVGIALGVVAARYGGSLAAAVTAVFAPNAALQWLTGGVAGSAYSLVVAFGTVVYVSGSVAVAGGLLAYAAGVRWRTGVWAASIGAHLGGDDDRWRLLGGWTVVVVGLVGAQLVAPAAVSLGLVQFATTSGGLVVAGWVGRRAVGLDLAVAVGVVGAAGLAFASLAGVVANAGATPAWLLRQAALVVGAGVVAGVPVGVTGYVAGRAVRVDMGD